MDCFVQNNNKLKFTILCFDNLIRNHSFTLMFSFIYGENWYTLVLSIGIYVIGFDDKRWGNYFIRFKTYSVQKKCNTFFTIICVCVKKALFVY